MGGGGGIGQGLNSGAVLGVVGGLTVTVSVLFKIYFDRSSKVWRQRNAR